MTRPWTRVATRPDPTLRVCIMLDPNRPDPNRSSQVGCRGHVPSCTLVSIGIQISFLFILNSAVKLFFFFICRSVHAPSHVDSGIWTAFRGCLQNVKYEFSGQFLLGQRSYHDIAIRATRYSSLTTRLLKPSKPLIPSGEVSFLTGIRYNVHADSTTLANENC